MPNASNSPKLALPKPEPRKRTKARKKRQEQAVAKVVREQVDLRDGYCRLPARASLGSAFVVEAFGMCEGASEWAHFGEKKRFKTRGMDPEDRHTIEDSLKLCQKHHDDYDDGKLAIAALDPEKRCEDRLRFERDGKIWEET